MLIYFKVVSIVIRQKITEKCRQRNTIAQGMTIQTSLKSKSLHRKKFHRTIHDFKINLLIPLIFLFHFNICIESKNVTEK
jgi:hypothetical protein